MPKSVLEKYGKYKVGGYLYSLDGDPRLIASQGFWGKCNHVDKTLLFDSTINDREFLSVLIHETLEAIKANRELEIPHDVLQNIEDGMFTALVDNAELYVDLLTNLEY